MQIWILKTSYPQNFRCKDNTIFTITQIFSQNFCNFAFVNAKHRLAAAIFL